MSIPEFDKIIRQVYEIKGVEAAIDTINATVNVNKGFYSKKQEHILRLLGIVGIMQSKQYNSFDNEKVSKYLRAVASEINRKEIVQ